MGEMVADWYARSQEFATDLRGWIQAKAMDRYNIAHGSDVHKQIMRFVDLLLENHFVPLKKAV
jgi:hypothetical protein